MMIVEIEVPALDKKYDFQIDEEMPLAEIRQEAAEMICRKEQYAMTGDVERLLMWDAIRGTKLRLEQSAYENGLRTGSRILLI